MYFSFQEMKHSLLETLSILERHRQGLLTDSGQDSDHFMLGLANVSLRLVSVGVTIASHFPGTSSGKPGASFSLGLMAEGKAG